MIEAIVKNYLESVVSIPVYTEIPAKNQANEFYVIELVGGGESEEVKESSITIESHGSTLYRSSLLDQQMRDLMKNAYICEEIYYARTHPRSESKQRERNYYRFRREGERLLVYLRRGLKYRYYKSDEHCYQKRWHGELERKQYRLCEYFKYKIA